MVYCRHIKSPPPFPLSPSLLPPPSLSLLSLLLSLFPPLLSPAPSLPPSFVPSLSPPFPLSPSPLSRPLPPSLSLPCDFLEHLFHLHQVSWGTAPGQGEGGAGLDLCHGPTPSRIHKVSRTTPASCVFHTHLGVCMVGSKPFSLHRTIKLQLPK